MGRYFILFSILVLGLSLSLPSCSESTQPDTYLLPTKIQAEDINSSSVFTYSYDKYRRLLEVVERRSVWENTVEDNEIKYSINYDLTGKISSLIRSSVTVINNSHTINSNDTVYFKYAGKHISVHDNFGEGSIQLNDSNQVVLSELFTEANRQTPEKHTYEYDARGNMVKYTSVNGIEAYSYTYDQNDGIFRNVNTPQWFMVVMLHEKNNLKNNYINQTLLQNARSRAKYGIRYEYNMEGYPVAQRDIREGLTESIETFTPHTTIVYKSFY